MVPFSRSQQISGFIAWLILSLGAAAVGAQASIMAASFYQELLRPAWAPPGSVFGPVWSVLYLSMAVASWMVWRERGFRGSRSALTLFIGQLVANSLWSWLFFAWRKGALASAEIVVLWLLILATVMAFWRVRRLAGILLLPYLAWVTFATALCFTVWRSNPHALGG